MVREKLSSSSMMGRSRSMGFPHFPHFGRSAARETSMRFQLVQNWQRSVAVEVEEVVVVPESICSLRVRSYSELTPGNLQEMAQERRSSKHVMATLLIQQAGAL